MFVSLLQRIEGLRHCRDLTELYLYSNQISQIEGLEGLTKLTKLWLNGNRISAIEVSPSIISTISQFIVTEF